MKTWNWMEDELEGYNGEGMSVAEAAEAAEREEREALWAAGYPDAYEWDGLADAVSEAARRALESMDPEDWGLFSDLYKDLNGVRPRYGMEEIRRIYRRA